MLSEKINLVKFKKIVVNSKTLLDLLKKRLVLIEFDMTDNDNEYKKHFENSIGPTIQNMHQKYGLIYCAFCSNLKKSFCHKYCFSCSKNFFTECGLLLPGTFPFMSSYLDLEGNETIPWTLIPACEKYEQLEKQHYFKNFVSNKQSITVAFYEALEGLYLGISRGKKPCHICASVNIEIYNSCYKSEIFNDDKPCARILENIVKNYYG